MSDILTIESIAQVHEVMNLGKPKHPLITIFRHCEHRKDVAEAYRVRLDMYMISMKDGVQGSFGYGRNSYDFQEGAMTFIGPGQVMSGDGEVEVAEDSEGWSLMFHPDLIRKSELGRTIEDYSFFSYEVHEALHLSDQEKQSLHDLIAKIELELNQNIDKHSQKLIVSNIELLLDYCTRYYDRQFYTRSDLSKDTVTRFDNFIKDYFKTEQQLISGIPSVKFCGQQLNVSSNYLSDLLKKETGRNAQDHIHTFIIDKAKTSLLGSDAPISEIAYGLGFEYPPHFTKIFKRKTGKSPSEYRSLN